MARFLVVLGLVILLVGLLWPYLARIGLGRLPGDFVIQRDNVTFYFPLAPAALKAFQNLQAVCMGLSCWNSRNGGCREPQSSKRAEPSSEG